MHASKYINTASLVCLVLLACIGFRDDQLVLDNQIKCSSLGKTTSALSDPWSSVVLCFWVVSHEISQFCFSIFIGIVFIQVLFRQLYYWGVTSEASLSFLGDSVSHQIFWFSGSYSFSSSTPSIFQSLWCRLTAPVDTCTAHPYWI